MSEKFNDRELSIATTSLLLNLISTLENHQILSRESVSDLIERTAAASEAEGNAENIRVAACLREFIRPSMGFD